MEYTQATGRRKTSVARVYMKPGNGNLTINGVDYKDYFHLLPYQVKVQEPFRIAEMEGQYDVKVNVRGGGKNGQAEATRHGLAWALINENEDLKKPLKDEGYLTRDARMVERKKPGLKKARKRSQFRKR